MLQDTLACSVLFTIGHSNHSIGRFLELLEAAGVRLLADVRRVPRSQRNPQFNLDTLEAALAERGIGYWHFGSLGGMREPRLDSPNSAILEDVFRGYADHMSTAEFQEALDDLIGSGEERQVAVMCAEAAPRDCHRSFLADSAAARGHEVIHLLADGSRLRHEISPLARVEGSRVTYPGLW